jgi:hypothetical protein
MIPIKFHPCLSFKRTLNFYPTFVKFLIRELKQWIEALLILQISKDDDAVFPYFPMHFLSVSSAFFRWDQGFPDFFRNPRIAIDIPPSFSDIG